MWDHSKDLNCNTGSFSTRILRKHYGERVYEVVELEHINKPPDQEILHITIIYREA